jgi:hypothetical protein
MIIIARLAQFLLFLTRGGESATHIRCCTQAYPPPLAGSTAATLATSKASVADLIMSKNYTNWEFYMIHKFRSGQNINVQFH